MKMSDAPARTWMRLALTKPPLANPLHPAARHLSAQDALALAHLMESAYKDAIDYDGETLADCIQEMESTLGGKYGPLLDFASAAVFTQDRAVAACLITLWKGRPLLTYSMTAPDARRQGLAESLIKTAIHALAAQGYADLHLVVTNGNTPAEALYRRLGFSALAEGPPAYTLAAS